MDSDGWTVTWADPAGLRPHPRRHVVRDLTEEEYKPLKAGIAEHGVEVPLCVTGDGTVLCGHNRLRAAVELGLPSVPAIRRDGLSEAEQLLHMVDDNVARRQLTASERAIIYTDPAIIAAVEDAAKQRQAGGLRRGAKPAAREARPRSDSGRITGAGRTVDIVAAAAQTGPALIADALLVRDLAPEKVEEIKAHTTTVTAEAREIRRRRRGGPDKPKKAKAEGGPKGIVVPAAPRQTRCPGVDIPCLMEQLVPTLRAMGRRYELLIKWSGELRARGVYLRDDPRAITHWARAAKRFTPASDRVAELHAQLGAVLNEAAELVKVAALVGIAP